MSARFPRWQLALSFLLHVLALGSLQYWGSASRLETAPPLDLRMVQLVGGGNNRPGWVRPPEAAPAARPETVEPVEAPPKETRPVTPQKTVDKTASPDRKTPAAPAVTQPARRTDAATTARNLADGKGKDSQAAANPAARGAEQTGPEGPGVDMVSENSGSPGISNWLRRSQGTIFRNFRFPARNSGRAVVYHFIVTPDGKIGTPELVKGSGDSVLDHAGLVAIRTSQLPPLPPEARLKALGVTITFRD